LYLDTAKLVFYVRHDVANHHAIFLGHIDVLQQIDIKLVNQLPSRVPGDVYQIVEGQFLVICRVMNPENRKIDRRSVK
jgi:hypothetical protein